MVDIDAGDRPGTLTWSEVLAGEQAVGEEQLAEAEATVTPETVCDILFTSGTTGIPKGVTSGHHQTIGVADPSASLPAR